MQTVTQLFVILQALHCALALSPQCGSAEDSKLILYVATANIYAQEHVWEHLFVILSNLAH